MGFDINEIIAKIARDEGVSPESVREEMQKAIDIAWQTKDEKAKSMQKELFSSEKPSLEEFITEIYKKIKDN